jgi:FAD/FMN-containing dehydrogenase/Fe-S oxidoreductase
LSEILKRRRRELQQAFESKLDVEVRFDPYTRALFSTDASNHRIEPIGVVFPRHTSELSLIAESASALDVPLLPRGAGTSLAGQAIGEAIIVDCSKYLNRIVEIDPESGAAIVEPGVVCEHLNRAAAARGLMYGPDPASANRATFGGMIGNNATGAHSIRYGMTADNVVRLDVTLSDGTEASFGPNDVDTFNQKASLRTTEGRIYRAARRMKAEYADAVAAHWPRTWRRSSGYGLNYLTRFTPAVPPAWHDRNSGYPPHNGFNLAPLLCGSEGTLALTRQARVRLVRRPTATLLVVLPFDSVVDAAAATPGLLESAPAAIELVPRAMLERAQRIPAYARMLTFVDEIPEALLVVEFAGESTNSLRQKAAKVARRGRVLEDPQEQANLWEVRKAGLGLLMSVPGDVKPITFIEDVAVPVDQLADYVASVTEIIREHGTTAEWYAHASAGCLHLRPMVNLKTSEGVEQMRAIADQVATLVIGMGGSLSGEHGDGLSHTEFNGRLFGPTLTQAFHELKRAFDPQGLLNPGKIIPSDRAEPPRLDRRLRYGPRYRPQPINTHFAYQREGGLTRALESCTGVGVCRKEEGLMCPSYQATRDEGDLTRGRANALRAAISSALPAGALTSEPMYQIFDLCLECKGCKAECPTGVDIARIKSEFLAQYQAEHGVPLRSRLFANIHSIASSVRPFAPLANTLMQFDPLRRLGQTMLGLAPQRKLPPFRRRTFRDRWDGPIGTGAPGQRVILFVDTFTEFNYPEIGMAAVRVLEAAHLKPELVTGQGCCGRPAISKGMLTEAQRLAEANITALTPLAQAGVPIVVLEPSCLSTLRDEYVDLMPGEAGATAVADQANLFEEFLLTPDGSGRPIDRIRFRETAGNRVQVHTHCHAKSMIGTGPTADCLRIAGFQPQEIGSGCCGMAGSFGYEQEHYDLSMQIGELKVLPAVRQAAARGELVAAHGVSCRTQMHDGADVEAQHPAVLLASRLASRSPANAETDRE